MATTTLLTADQYLKMHFEERAPEFVHGELIERSMPTPLHGRLHYLLALRLQNVGFGVIGVHMRLADDVIRIPDLAIFRDPPESRMPSSPPFIIVEIISPDDRHAELMKKFDQYRAWGVEHIWVVEPDIQKLHVYESRGLIEVKQFELPESKIRIDAAALFAEASAR